MKDGKMEQLKKLARLMQCHESQQSAAVVATIAILIGNKIEKDGIQVSEECRRALGDIMLWDTPVIWNEFTWPSRQKYSFKQIFSEPEELIETKIIVHGYLGNKASREMEQFFSEGELKRITHYENGIWIAPTCSTFKSYLPDIFSRKTLHHSPEFTTCLVHTHVHSFETRCKSG